MAHRHIHNELYRHCGNSYTRAILTLWRTSSNCRSVPQPNFLSSYAAMISKQCTPVSSQTDQYRYFCSRQHVADERHSLRGSPAWTAARTQSEHGACIHPGRCYESWSSYKYKTESFCCSRSSSLPVQGSLTRSHAHAHVQGQTCHFRFDVYQIKSTSTATSFFYIHFWFIFTSVQLKDRCQKHQTHLYKLTGMFIWLCIK